MKTKLNLLAFLTCLFVLQSCSDKDSVTEIKSSVQEKELISRMNKDPLVQTYKRTIDSMFKNVLYNKYNISKLNKANISKELSLLKSSASKNARTASPGATLKAYSKIYTDAGMTSSTEYISLMNSAIYYKVKIEEKYPQIRQLDPSEQKAFYKKLFGRSNHKVDPMRFAEGRPSHVRPDFIKKKFELKN